MLHVAFRISDAFTIFNLKIFRRLKRKSYRRRNERNADNREYHRLMERLGHETIQLVIRIHPDITEMQHQIYILLILDNMHIYYTFGNFSSINVPIYGRVYLGLSLRRFVDDGTSR